MLFLKKSLTVHPARPEEAQAQAQAHEEAQAQEEAQDEWWDDPPEREDLEVCVGTLTTFTRIKVFGELP